MARPGTFLVCTASTAFSSKRIKQRAFAFVERLLSLLGFTHDLGLTKGLVSATSELIHWALHRFLARRSSIINGEKTKQKRQHEQGDGGALSKA